MKYGVQMYAIRTLCKDDLEAGIRAASEIGYEGLEFAGFFGHSAEEVSGWLKNTARRPWARIFRLRKSVTIRTI